MSVNPFANAQVCCGGVDANEVDGTTMESKICPGLYLAGEILDVDGICGGYNLQFAWSSGMIGHGKNETAEMPQRRKEEHWEKECREEKQKKKEKKHRKKRKKHK